MLLLPKPGLDREDDPVSPVFGRCGEKGLLFLVGEIALALNAALDVRLVAALLHVGPNRIALMKIEALAIFEEDAQDLEFEADSLGLDRAPALRFVCGDRGAVDPVNLDRVPFLDKEAEGRRIPGGCLRLERWKVIGGEALGGFAKGWFRSLAELLSYELIDPCVRALFCSPFIRCFRVKIDVWLAFAPLACTPFSGRELLEIIAGRLHGSTF